MKYKAKPEFKELDISNDYQGLGKEPEKFLALKQGKAVELSKVPDKLKGYLEKVKTKGK